MKSISRDKETEIKKMILHKCGYCRRHIFDTDQKLFKAVHFNVCQVPYLRGVLTSELWWAQMKQIGTSVSHN